MAYVRIKDRGLVKKEVIIISEKFGFHSKMIREDRISSYVNDYIFFNELKGTSYVIKETL